MSELISVIIPTYKDRGGLKRAISSVLSQEKVNVEIIVVDDNDPKTEWRAHTEILMEEYKHQDNIVYIQNKKNSNGAVARNNGIKVSHGNYIAFLDDDDSFLPDKLIRQLTFLQNNPQFDAVYGQTIRSGKTVTTTLPEGDLSKDILLLNSQLKTPTLFFRADSIKSIGGFDERFYRHQDFEMLLRYFQAGYKVGAIQYPVFEYGKNGGENIPKGEKLETIKKLFFESFDSYIEDINKRSPGFKKEVYARHYSGVFLSHIKNGYLLMALKHLLKYTFTSPLYFWKPIFKSIIIHISGNQ